MSALKLHDKYETGQFFLHSVFGYRGVVLFPWRAKVYDRNPYTSTPDSDESATSSIDLDTSPVESSTTTDTDTNTKRGDGKSAKNIESPIAENSDTTNGRSDSKKEVTVKVENYYQVLVDVRDCPHVVSFTLKNATFFAQKFSFIIV